MKKAVIYLCFIFVAGSFAGCAHKSNNEGRASTDNSYERSQTVERSPGKNTGY